MENQILEIVKKFQRKWEEETLPAMKEYFKGKVKERNSPRKGFKIQRRWKLVKPRALVEPKVKEGKKIKSRIVEEKITLPYKHVLGAWSSTLFAIALLSSGQSSTITGTYAGQYVMQGFLELRFTPWVRNLLTRCVAIVPSLFAALLGGLQGAGKLIIISSMILSFELPFALLPLLKFTSNNVKMGPHVNSKKVTMVTWIIGFCIILVNMFYLSNGFFHWIVNTTLPRSRVIFIGILGVASLIAYIGFTLYLALRTDSTETYNLPEFVEVTMDDLNDHDYHNESFVNEVEGGRPSATAPSP